MGFGGRFVGMYSGILAGRPYPPTLNTLVFDTGINKPQRAVVIDSVVNLLQRLHRYNGGYLEAIVGSTTVVRGPEDTEACADIVEELNGQTPGVVVATGDMDFDTAGDIDRWRSPLRVHVYFLCSHMRDHFDGRGIPDVVALADGRADPGVFVAMEHARMLLVAQRAGTVGLKDLRPHTERRINTDGDREIWEQIYICYVTHNINAKRDVTLELKQINTYNRLAEQLVTDEPIVSIESEVGHE